MKKIFFLLVLCSSVLLSKTQSFNKLHRRFILIDTHNDIPQKALAQNLVFDHDLRGLTHTDLSRMKMSGMDAQFFAIFCDGNEPNPYAMANRQIDTVLAWTGRNGNYMIPAKNVNDVRQISRRHQLAVLFGVEGGHMIENDLGKLDSLYNRGARYLTLTWNNSTSWATSAADETHRKDSLKFTGLSTFGRQVVQRMNELGMMVDLSHVGERTFDDVINHTKKPVLVSHSCVCRLCPHPRNLKDDQIRSIGKNGGVIQLNFFSGFLDSTYERKSRAFSLLHKAEVDSMRNLKLPNHLVLEYLVKKYPAETAAIRPPFSLLMDHLNYVVKLIGVDHVGLGSDFDGISSTPVGLDDVSHFPVITKALLDAGYSKKDVRKILGGNLLRVMAENER